METLSFSNFFPTYKSRVNFKKLITHKLGDIISTSSKPNVVVHGNGGRKQILHERIFKTLDNVITTFTSNLSLPASIDPKRVLTGNFSPVDELPPTACEVVEGSIPPSLDGVYILNTPNPQFVPRGPYHLADGDGMLHSVKISKGKSTYCSRYVKTYKYTMEHDLGYPVIPNFIASFINNKYYKLSLLASLALYFARTVTGQINPSVNGIGTANTSLALFGRHLFALVESDLPYSIKITADGDIITLERHDFNITEPFMSITAHPKIDPDTGELFAFKYSGNKPYLTFFWIDPNGTKRTHVPIFSMMEATFVHDFALTRSFAVFPDTQIVSDPWHVTKGKPMIEFRPDKVPRLGVIPRYAEDESEMQWMDVPGLNMVHVVNAWEEDDGETIVIMAANSLSFENFLEQMHMTQISLEKIVIDTKEMKVVMRQPVSSRSLEFGVINPQYTGKKNRYIYAAEMEQTPKIAGVVKVDLSLLAADYADCVVASRMYGAGCYGSQPIFVATDPNNLTGNDEDDGYLLSYVHNENTNDSHLLIMDAKSSSLETVAAVKLPRRVPYGFHSIFVNDSDLNNL